MGNLAVVLFAFLLGVNARRNLHVTFNLLVK